MLLGSATSFFGLAWFETMPADSGPKFMFSYRETIDAKRAEEPEREGLIADPNTSVLNEVGFLFEQPHGFQEKLYAKVAVPPGERGMFLIGTPSSRNGAGGTFKVQRVKNGTGLFRGLTKTAYITPHYLPEFREAEVSIRDTSAILHACKRKNLGNVDPYIRRRYGADWEVEDVWFGDTVRDAWLEGYLWVWRDRLVLCSCCNWVFYTPRDV
ncbi:hypothetical protein DL771_004032 [Monosporascus sp. 5C6A]|nr:hypothetical protein DL771_004032 [Monosporascus sp. 5C6A]